MGARRCGAVPNEVCASAVPDSRCGTRRARLEDGRNKSWPCKASTSAHILLPDLESTGSRTTRCAPPGRPSGERGTTHRRAPCRRRYGGRSRLGRRADDHRHGGPGCRRGHGEGAIQGQDQIAKATSEGRGTLGGRDRGSAARRCEPAKKPKASPEGQLAKPDRRALDGETFRVTPHQSREASQVRSHGLLQLCVCPRLRGLQRHRHQEGLCPAYPHRRKRQCGG